MSTLRFVDTNVLLYSISGEPAEAAKRNQALAVLDRNDLALSVQVLSEFYVQATRATWADKVAREVAAGLIRCWMRFIVQDNTVSVLPHALEIRASHRLSSGTAHPGRRLRSGLPGTAERGFRARPRLGRRANRQSVQITKRSNGRGLKTDS